MSVVGKYLLQELFVVDHQKKITSAAKVRSEEIGVPGGAADQDYAVASFGGGALG